MVRPPTEKRRVRTCFDGYQVKGSKTLVKSSWEHFDHILSSLWGELIRKKCPLFKFKIIEVFVNTHGLPIASIVFRFVRICRSQLKCNYLKNKRYFISFLFHLWNPHQISNISKKKKILIANVLPKLRTV